MAFRCIGRKEFIALIQIIIASLAIANYSVLHIYEKVTIDRMLFEHMCVNVAIAYINFFYALGTWFYTSNISITRLMARVHTVITYIGLITLLYVTRSRYMERYTYRIWYFFSFEDVFDENFNSFNVSLALVQFIFMLSGIVGAVESYMVYARFAVYLEKKMNKQQET